MSDVVKSNAMKGKRFKEHWKWQRGLTSYPKSGKERTSWRQKWFSDTSRERNGKVERFRGQTVIDGSSMGPQDGKELAVGLQRRSTMTKKMSFGELVMAQSRRKQFEIWARSTFFGYATLHAAMVKPLMTKTEPRPSCISRRQLRQQTKLGSKQLEECRDLELQTRPPHPSNTPALPLRMKTAMIWTSQHPGRADSVHRSSKRSFHG